MSPAINVRQAIHHHNLSSGLFGSVYLTLLLKSETIDQEKTWQTSTAKLPS
jgi:hypothetical protein